MGKNSIMEVLKYSPDRIVKVYTAKGDTGQGDGLLHEIQRAGIEVATISKGELMNMVNSESHQSYIAVVKDAPAIDIDNYLDQSFDRDTDFILALDSINDPQNLGSLLRSAECFGVNAVMWSKNRGVDITPVAAKASVGASEIVPIIRVSNLVEAIKKCKTQGYQILSAEVGQDAHSLYEFEFPAKTVLIMGSEGPGVRQLLSRQTDHKIYIPMLGKIDSLNVSQATAVTLSHWRRRDRTK